MASPTAETGPRNGNLLSIEEAMGSRILALESNSHQLFDTSGNESIYQFLSKARDEADGGDAPHSNIKPNGGRKEHPFDRRRVKLFLHANVHHSTCIATKVSSHVGLGFKNEKVEEILDPLCEIDTQDLQDRSCNDFWQCGDGYVEVVREAPTIAAPIVYMAPLPCEDTHVVVEGNGVDRHYEIDGGDNLGSKRFAVFGDIDDFIARGGSNSGFELPEDKRGISEVINFPCSNSFNRWYGVPGWLSATSAIELVQTQMQYKYDFLVNRAVPEFLLFLLGAKLSKSDWEQVQLILNSGIGKGNSRKSGVFNFANPELKIELEKLAIEGKSDDGFVELNDALAFLIVSAHQVPPLLAGIQVPGKLGATNELPNALSAFQVLLIGQKQKAWESRWNNTLGNPDINGGLKLKRGMFEYKTILDEIDLGMMDTTARMRDPVASGRDPKKGLKKSGWRRLIGG